MNPEKQKELKKEENPEQTLLTTDMNYEDKKEQKKEVNQEQKTDCSLKPVIVPNYLDVIKNITYNRTEFYEYYKKAGDQYPPRLDNFIVEFGYDIFTAHCSWPLAHCVSEDLAMGKGIAKEFKIRFGNVEFLRQQCAPVGDVAVLYHTDTNGNSRFVFYLVTKQYYHSKPTYFNIFCALYRLRQICVAFHIHKVAMPRIACGLDKKDFSRIKELIHVAFAGACVLVGIYKNESQQDDISSNGVEI